MSSSGSFEPHEDLTGGPSEQSESSSGHTRESDGEVPSTSRNAVSIHRHTTNLTIKGIPVKFPGEPYPAQEKMMESVIEGLELKENILIESPTGTGKTLALLCAVLAWKKERQFTGKIYYTTRTHSQVSGVVKELKKTDYCNEIKTTILGSRNQLCINPDKPTPMAVNQIKVSVDSFCQQLRHNHYKRIAEENVSSDEAEDEQVAKKKSCICGKTCEFYFGKETGQFGNNKISQVLDIEEYRQHVKNTGDCPYYTTRKRHHEAEIIFCPYNYIVSRQLRKTCEIELDKSIVIFDEGHNLEKACCDEASLSLKAKSVASTILKCKNARTRTSPSSPKPPPPVVQQKLENIESVLKSLESLIRENAKDQSSETDNNEVLNQLANVGLGLNGVCNLKEFLKSIRETEKQDNQIYLDLDVGNKLRKILGVLALLYSHCENGNLNDYQLFFSESDSESSSESDCALEIKCMNPALVFKEIAEGTTSVNITSGTLAPLTSFPRELGSTFHNPISLDQSIPPSRYFIAKVAYAQGTPPPQLELTFRNRDQDAVMVGIGNAVLRLCKIVPNGIILITSSGRYHNELLTKWTSAGILAKIMKYKHVFNEADKNVNLQREYKDMSRNPGNGTQTGALLLAYFRGTMSEGVDFKDEEARLVITLGIPLMPFFGSEASARRRYNQFTFQTWYETDAFRAFNQGIGRCVRHREDWGAVVMMESRLCGEEYDEYLPRWIEQACQNYPGQHDFGKMLKELRTFVKKMTIGNVNETNNDMEENEDDEESVDEEEDNASDERHGLVEEENGRDARDELDDEENGSDARDYLEDEENVSNEGEDLANDENASNEEE